MYRKVTNHQGLTLIEILAALAITSLITILIFNVFIQSQNAYYQQAGQNEQLLSNTLILKELTREIRKTDTVKIEKDSNGNHLLVINNHLSYQWDSANKILYKNGSLFAKQIDEFIVDKIGAKVTIKIRSNDKVNQTVIVVRGET
ncbi:PulJ/GspJ family protein [Ureibacillus manganicus]|uniref:Prepilin-type N-terminal cleavage/methylation domain-containing protein n=1 Tax=Ureibacillus manganicus DSM 26584 TaxID=1384049 RepID=A0A0A3IA21_9BACL|nr:prepilin-type N-terminal cleavage/methylation domain-containing protein [Ureibacillus manganicus]KGR79653.1 hypothetical protein CD29_06025 [Ureibacillus manganicus DSM 26584]